MEFFTGISILCSMKQNWNENIIEKMMQAMKLVISRFICVSIENAFFWYNPDAKNCKYGVHFSVQYNVSSDVEKERKRCNLLLFVLKKIVKESLYAEVHLNGDRLLGMTGEEVTNVTKKEIEEYSKPE